MDWSNVAKTAGSLGLKVLGGALGGPAGAGIGGMVASALGLSADAQPDQVQQALATASPDSLVKLKQIEAEIVKANLAAGIEHRKIDTLDIQNARSRDLQLKQAGYRNTRADLMIVVAFVAFVAIAWMINVNDEIKPGVLAIFNMSIGALLKMLGDAFQFEFGSSRGSKEKDQLR